MQKKAVIGGAIAAAVLIGLGAWWAVDRSMDTEATERGTCGSATWELSTEAEDGGTDVSAELRSSGPGETWNVSLTRDEQILLEGERTTDDDAEIDVDAFSTGSGSATFSVTFTPADGDPCTASVDS